MESDDLRAQLAQYTGTENIYCHSLVPRFLYTDGVRALARLAGAYWLLDILATRWEISRGVVHSGFCIACLAVADGQALLTVADTREEFGTEPTPAGLVLDKPSKSQWVNVRFTQQIAETDSPTGEWVIYLTWDAGRMVAMLPSEY